ncbi:hypothetical protein EB231_34810 [Mesorhizobium sp. NZP2298]|nr:hypothetical protein EB231_34810 [Mesorhizobium sp. NZP2298]
MSVGIPTLIALFTLLGAGLGAWYTLRGQVGENTKGLDKLEDENEKQLAALASALALANANIAKALEKAEEVRAKTARELDEYKLTVATNYATNNAIRLVEERVVAAIDRLGDRLDKWLDSPRNTQS